LKDGVRPKKKKKKNLTRLAYIKKGGVMRGGEECRNGFRNRRVVMSDLFEKRVTSDWGMH